jgi:hypothetical protein
MSLAQLYEQHADDCERTAAKIEDPGRRALLLKLADLWRRDAQQLRQQATDTARASAPELARTSQATRMRSNKLS